ncbi:MAG TPA: GAF and ANTAR domain-containing protein [Actinomycetales bacterium]
MTDDHSAFERSATAPWDALGELGSLVLGELDLPMTLHRVAEIAERVVVGTDAVSVTLMEDGAATTAAYTQPLALHLDERQYERGHGPCLDCIARGEVLRIDDMAAEDRWPDYAPQARELGAGSSVSLPLFVTGRPIGALNVYATSSHAFDPNGIDIAQVFAEYAGVALANHQLYATTARLAAQMQAALSTRSVIEQAKGILIAMHGGTSDQALRRIVGDAERRGVDPAVVATEIVRLASGPGDD